MHYTSHDPLPLSSEELRLVVSDIHWNANDPRDETVDKNISNELDAYSAHYVFLLQSLWVHNRAWVHLIHDHIIL